jgi:predicted  nucleic acid-binding Zn-ribbon protein
MPEHKPLYLEVPLEEFEYLHAEVKRLGIEMHRLAHSRQGQRERAERAEAEVARLRAEVQKASLVITDLIAERQTLEVEIGRLRAVLDEIAAEDDE